MKKNFTKKLLSILAVFSLGVLVLTSCSKDDDPKDNDVFIGTYKGKVTYVKVSEDKNISNDNGSVLVSKLGDTYKFNFSDGIPSIEKELKKGENGFTLEWGEGSVITIDENKLTIHMIKDGALWTADCKR